ncbi:hypothetical protein [Cellulomonas pakistanensis]|uniref:Uncharacterized protein n=1 Tax=Cellulomonas pakistanensis TaxID=992287 RepID=A0A919U6B6_9CELL|nr:hypothetical protein [Cellulomonas pakistanensis]GIG36100.1 hypothetical protein Cpa01nite_14810 [Cellulomonas pakistanensis]
MTAALAVPDRLPVLLLAVAVAAVPAVLLGQLRPAVVVPVAAVVAAATWRLVPPPPRADARHVTAVAALVVLCAAWVVVGWRTAAEYVVVNRDPGFLTLRALWLAEHPSALIGVGDAAAAAAAVPGAAAGTEAFWLDGGSLHVQGNVLLPALLAVQGWLGGEQAVLAGNLGIGVVALAAVYALARRLVGPVWALVPTAGLAVSLPFLTFTRAAYTEPLTVAFLCGGLALAHGAWTARGSRPARRHLLVGALVGAVATARIDGAVAVVGLVLGYLLLAAGPLGRADRRGARRAALAAVGGATAMTLLGLADVVVLSPAYVREHAGQLTALLGAAALVVVVAVTLLLVPPAWSARTRTVVHRHRAGVGAGAAAAVLCLAVALASRPLWWQGRATDPATGYGHAVQVLQAAAGQPLDAARSYDEQTLTWVAWYLGGPAVVLGFAGLALLAHRAVARRDPAATLVVAVIGVAAVFPLLRVSITPDQIWAVRRLLPATFPGLLVAGAVALAALAGTGAGPARWGGARRAAAGVLALTVVGFPLTTWRPGASVVELSGRATQAHAVCDALDDLGVERVVWTHSSPFRYLATLRVVCDVEVVEFVEPPTTADLAAVRAAWGGGPVAALSFDATDYAWTAPPTASVGGTASTTLGRTLTGVPRTVDTTWSEVWVGLVQGDGSVAPAG